MATAARNIWPQGLDWEWAMTNRGKWGVTRDKNGELADLWSWPWFWRYPSGLALIAAGIPFAFWASGMKSEWVGWLLAGGAVFFALCVMYELGCLVLVLALVGSLWWLGNNFLPDYELPPKVINIIGIGVAATAAFIAHDCLKEIRAVRKELAQAMQDARAMASVTNNLVTQRQAVAQPHVSLDWDDDE